MAQDGGKFKQLELSMRSALPTLYARLSDADLVQRAKGGDRAAVDALIERYSARVSRLAANLLDDIEDARDAAQESLLKLSVRVRQFRGDSQFSTWLHRLVINTCHDVAARQQLRRMEELGDDYAEFPALGCDPSHGAVLAELRRELASELERLSSEQREIVILRDALGLSYEEISRLLLVPVGTAKSCVHRGRARLRRGLEEYATA